MPIEFNAQANTFDLYTDHTSYQLKIGPCGLLLHLYYGPIARGDMSFLLPRRGRSTSGSPYEAGGDNTISADTLPMEYPFEGCGDYRPTAFGIRRGNGASGCYLRYAGYEILPGKYALPGLPAAYANSEAEAQTLLITLRDDNAGVEVILQYGVFPKRDVITRAVKVTNTGIEALTLQNAASASLDFLAGDWELMSFHGRHEGERAPSRRRVGSEELVVGSRRGASSHQQNPFVILLDKDATEDCGACCGMSFVYSGSFECRAARDPFGTTRLIMGIQPERFEYALPPGESFLAPEVILAFTTRGLTDLSHILHGFIRNNIIRDPWKDRRRPVLINNWEATGADFTGERIVSIARQAAQLGVEMMVLDDGWFGARDNDRAGLGDWVVNEKKLGCTMGELAARIRALGMKFGLWIEPEMVNEDSDLYRAHPDWAFQLPGQPPVRSRNQLVLDFSRPEIVDAVFEQIAAVLDECRADYVKMDMNRSVCDVCTRTQACQSQGEVLYRYMLGVYRFIDRLLERYPDLLLEGCAGGGGRFDAGMLYYCPQIWCSDNTDPIDRIRIQYGTSFGYPVSAMGAHVSASPFPGTGRLTPINTRAVVAMEGTFGYELDLNLISDEEKDEVRAQISTFKQHWKLLQDGLYYRLTDVMENREEAAWMLVAQDRSEAMLSIVTLNTTGNSPNRYVRCRGLEPGASYADAKTGQIYPANALMFQGLLIPQRRPGEYQAFQLHLRRVC